jgi:Spy/CpxP family protein refolding chaperone
MRILRLGAVLFLALAAPAAAQEKPATAPAPPTPTAEPSDPEDMELEELAAVLALAPAQKAEIRKILREGQDEFERRLTAATRENRTDPGVIEKIGEEVSKEVEAKVLKVLDEKQRAAYKKWLAEKEEEAKREEGGEGSGEPPAPKK